MAFFKSIWFKCIAVLLCISLISGGLLAVLNNLLYVSAEERTMRAIKKIYGEEKTYDIILDIDSDDENINTPLSCGEFGVINKIYIVGDKESGSYDYLFNATGNGGYKNGTITLWVQVSHTDSGDKIEKTVLESFDKQTLMSKLGGDFYDGFSGEVSGEYYSAKQEKDTVFNPVSGATFSATAADNAVNCVVYFLRGKLYEKLF